jgi:hypothetical protein|tara:strand:+ start:121 stop:765 length:645 start_codon:yes stop_codon:yes gene_type:complete
MEFIYECEDAFPVSFCNRVIEKFEKSDLKFMGRTDAGINPQKKSTDLRIYDEPEWVEEEKSFHDMIRKAMKNYETFLLKMNIDDEVKKEMSEILMCSHIHPPQIQRTEPGQYYHWHHDQRAPYNWDRFTYIIYLNDVEKDSGGTTNFSCGKTIQPRVGKIVFFPSTWTYFHRGKTLEKGVKYIATNALMLEHPRRCIKSRLELKPVLPFIISRD